MIDYCFTVFVFHFIIVSIVENDFPVYGAWWVACGVGLILFMLISERVSYHLETMSYQSSLHEAKYKSRKSKTEETELPEISEEEEHFTSSGSYSSKNEEKLKEKPKHSSEEGGNGVSFKKDEEENGKEEESSQTESSTKQSESSKSSDSKEKK